MPILVMLHTGSTFLFSVMVCVIFPGSVLPQYHYVAGASETIII